MLIGQGQIGISPGIGRTGWGQSDLLTSANLRKTYSHEALPTSGLVAARTIMDSLPTSGLIAVRSYVATLYTSADILRASILQTSANLRGIIDMDPLLTSALLAQTILMSTLPTSGLLADRTVMSSLPTSANLMARFYAVIETSGLLADRTVMSSLPTSAWLIWRYWLASLPTSALLADRTVMSSLPTDANLILRLQVSLPTSANLIDNIHYYALVASDGTLINLRNKIYNRKTKGFDLKTTALKTVQKRGVILVDEGIEAPIITFEPLFWKSYLKQAFLAVAHNDAVDLRYHDGRSDRYFRVKRIGVSPGFDEHYRGNFSEEVELKLEDPYLYSALPQLYAPGYIILPTTTGSMNNWGTVSAPLTFVLGGYYSGGQVTNLYLKTIDGSTTERNLFVTPQLLSKELATLDFEGWSKLFLTHSYDDDFSDIGYWQHDSSNTGCTIGSGQVSVASGGYFIYCFKGYPLLENIKLTAQITVSSGSPIIQVSEDGSTWETAAAASELSAGSGRSWVYYLTGSKNKTTIYVRFYCPSGAAMTVQDLSFELYRTLSSQVDNIPVIEAQGDTRTFKVEGSGSGRASVDLALTPRWTA